MSNDVNVWASKEEATNFAVDENKKSENHPAFYLYSQEPGASTSKFEGRLMRQFGTDNYYWES
jgi:hypothetical protein